MSSPFSRSHSLVMISRHLAFFWSRSWLRARIAAAPEMLASGFRISWANPAESCPMADRRSTRFMPSKFACTFS